MSRNSRVFTTTYPIGTDASWIYMSRNSRVFTTLDAYEHTQAPWSIILDDDEDVHKFVDEAYDHLKNKDYRWLCKHFV